MAGDILNLKRWRIWLIVSVVVSAVSMGIIFSMTVTTQGLSYFLRLPVEFIVLAFLIHVASWFFWALRIKILARSLNVDVPLIQCFKIVLVNLFVACVTPSGMGGEPARILMLREYMGSGNATAITIGERIIDFIFFGSTLPIFLILLGMSINMEDIKYYLIGVAIILILGGVAFIYLILNRKKIRRSLTKLERIVGFFIKNPNRKREIMRKMEMEYDAFFKGTFIIFRKKRFLALAFIATSLLWIVDFLIPSIILIGLGFDPHWLFILTSMVIIILITIIPITPGGSGLAEFSGYFLFSQIMPDDIAGILVILWRIITFYPNLLLGLFYTMRHLSHGGENGE